MHPTAARLAERLEQRGLDIEVRTLSDSARTAALAAAALDVEVGQIVKSLVFLRGDEPVLVLCAGDRRVDAGRLGLAPATAERVRAVTGFSIGGVPPLGHDVELETMIDGSLLRAGLGGRGDAARRVRREHSGVDRGDPRGRRDRRRLRPDRQRAV
jgi:prolyl-tRNA editing enzyme YbaK/EbsC (Cys-tRNA(Pro) deacylase)